MSLNTSKSFLKWKRVDVPKRVFIDFEKLEEPESFKDWKEKTWNCAHMGPKLDNGKMRCPVCGEIAEVGENGYIYP